MDKIKKLILFPISTSICNFRCQYCYLTQRGSAYKGVQWKPKYSPEQVRYALRPERLGGKALMNFCADGETLLAKDLEKYIRLLCEDGHYIEIVTNMTISKKINEFLSWPKELLKHLEFKCSFHYLELIKHGLLEEFAINVNNAWNAGASAMIELTPHDELIPYIDEIMEFSIKHFGALPQLTIARNDSTSGIEMLTNLSPKTYKETWSRFNSNFWKYKMSVFGVKQKGFCYAGMWSATISLDSGIARKCYFNELGNVFENPDLPFPESPVGKCPIAHCYNAHAFLTLGCIPNATNIRYGEIRNRIKCDGSSWLKPELLSFFNTTLAENNKKISLFSRALLSIRKKISALKRATRHFSKYTFSKHIKKNNK